MTNIDDQPQKWTLKKRNLTIAVLLVFLLQLAIFAYLYLQKNDITKTIQIPIAIGKPTPLYGIYGSGAVGAMDRPLGVTVYNRKIFVTDASTRKISVFDYDGKPLYSFGSMGAEQGKFMFPYGIAVDDTGKVYVADMNTGKISILTQEGEFLGYFSPETKFLMPAGLFIFENTVYVSDVGLHNIKAFDLSGKKLLEFGQKGSSNGEFVSPNCLTVTKDFIYVADSGNDRVQKFDKTGKFLSVNTGDLGENAQSSAYVNVRGLGVDGRGVLYVVSNLTCQLWGFDNKDKKLFDPVGSIGKGNNELYLPNGLFVDSQGRIYITDPGNQRVMVYQN